MSQSLKANALSIADTVALAIAGSAPSYSLNATTAALIATVGFASPAALLLGAIPMFGISFAFKYLNEWRADAGATYAWVGRSLNPYLGFLSAWTFLTLSTAFMVAATLPLGVTTLSLFAPQLQENVLAATVVGGLWFAGVATLTMLGVHFAASVQRIMTGLETIALLVLAVGAFIKFSANPVNPFSWQWFSPQAFGSPETFMAGMLVAVFYYFGWDVSSNVAEETQDSNSAAGKSGVIGMVGVVVLLILIQVSVQMGLSQATIEQNSANILGVLGDAILPAPWGKVAVLAIILSTVGTIETQMTQCARALFSMSRDRVVHEKFSEIHPQFQTPWLASLLVTVLALFLLILSSSSESIATVMTSLISSIGIMVSLYYGMTGLACAWYYRKLLKRDWQTLVMKGIWPAASAVFLLGLGVMQIPTLGWDVSLYTLGAIAVGLLPMIYFRLAYRSNFYTQPIEQYIPYSAPMQQRELDLVK